MSTTLDRCEELSSPDIANFLLSAFLLVGILVSYLPQHFRIIQRRSSEGLSPYFVLLGATSGTCAIANILVLPTSRADIACCSVNGAFSCAAGLLGIAQIGVQWSCFFLVTLLYLVFIPRYAVVHGRDVEERLEPTNTALRGAVIVVSASIAHFILTFLISVVMLARYPHLLGTWANTLGILCAILASIQYIPQIWMTWRLKHIGSLSIPTMCIQTPGAFIFAASLAARLGKDGWSAWMVYVVTGVLQGCLLVMAISFELRERRVRNEGPWDSWGTGEEDLSRPTSLEHDSETTPLIRDGQEHRSGVQTRHSHNHPLAPHRLNPDPDSSDSELGSRSPSRNGNEGHDLIRKGSLQKKSTGWFSSLTRQG